MPNCSAPEIVDCARETDVLSAPGVRANAKAAPSPWWSANPASALPIALPAPPPETVRSNSWPAARPAFLAESAETPPGAADSAAKGEGALPYYSMRQFAVVHNDLTNAGKAANEIKRMLKEAGVDKKTIRRVAVAAYEQKSTRQLQSL